MLNLAQDLFGLPNIFTTDLPFQFTQLSFFAENWENILY